MRIIDIHTHIRSEVDERKELISLFHNKSIPSNKFFSIGIHPWHADKNKTKSLIDELHPKARQAFAVGECGLDKMSSTDFDKQISVFRQQIELSESLKKPLIIHSVKTYPEIISLHKEYKPSQDWIVHGFTGNIQIMDELVNHGIFISFGELLMKAIKKTEEVFFTTPLDKLFLETDESVYDILDIYKQAARIKNISIENLSNQIEKNLKFISEK